MSMIYNDRIKNKDNADIYNKKMSTTFVIGIMTSTFVLFTFVYINSEIFNNGMDAAALGNTTHTTSANSTAIKSNSSSNQPNSNVSRLSTTQGNISTNANAPGSPFPPKEANSTSYFPTTNKVAIVVGAALLRDKAYQPNPVNVKTGAVVTWNNEDTVVHTVTSGTGLNDPYLGIQFDSGLLGAHFSHIFFKPGVFPYFCQIHPTMVGKVIVK